MPQPAPPPTALCLQVPMFHWDQEVLLHRWIMRGPLESVAEEILLEETPIPCSVELPTQSEDLVQFAVNRLEEYLNVAEQVWALR